LQLLVQLKVKSLSMVLMMALSKEQKTELMMAPEIPMERVM